MASKVQFCPLPLRALGDARLSGLELRLLAAIAYHDRLSISRGRGAGCWAGNQKLAQTCDCRLDSLSAAITNLVKCGYVTREPHPINKRLRVYRVIYANEAMANARESRADDLADAQESRAHDLADGQVSAPRPAILGQLPNGPEPILGQPKSQAPENNEKSGVEYIPHKREEILLKQKTNSPEGAPTLGVGDLARRLSLTSHGAALGYIERAARAGKPIGGTERQLIAEICAKAEPHGTIFHHANRLLSELGDADAA